MERKLSSSSVVAAAAPQYSDHHHHIVIGNEAGDADSIISAIVYAYLQDCIFSSSSSEQQHRRLLPIVSISNDDLQTQRPETLLLLQLVGIVPPQQFLITIDTLFRDVVVLNAASTTTTTTTTTTHMDVTLVDHNRFRHHERFRSYLPKASNNTDYDAADAKHQIEYTVVNIIDHHMDEGYHTETCTNENSTRNIAFDASTNVALVASTCTLLVEMLQHHYQHTPNENNKNSRPYLPASVSLLLLGVILLDSINMNVVAGKGTIRDGNAIQYLCQWTDWENTDGWPMETSQRLLDDNNNGRRQPPNTTRLFETLQNAKFALEFWQSLSVRDTLRLDYKMFSTNTATTTTPTTVHVGISTVLMSYPDWAMKEDFVSSVIQNFMIDMNIELLCIMLASRTNRNSHESKNLNREIVFVGPNVSFMDKMIDYFLQTDVTLQLVEISPVLSTFHDAPKTDAALHIRAFQQNNNAASRKQVAPLLIKYLADTTAAI